MRPVLGRKVYGLDMHKYGLPCVNMSGIIDETCNPGILDCVFAALERHPEIHAVSYMNDRRILNRFDEKANFHLLYEGENDPEIEFVFNLSAELKRQKENKNIEMPSLEELLKLLTQKDLFALQCLTNKLGRGKS